jgi:hypothetical protein
VTSQLVCIWVVLPLVSRYQMIGCTRYAFSGILWMELRLVHKIVILIESGSQHLLVMNLCRRKELPIALEAVVDSSFAFYFLSLSSFLGTLKSIILIGL